MALILLIGFIMLTPTSGDALQGAPTRWLRELCRQLESLSITPGSTILDIGQLRSFEAIGTFSDDTTQNFTDQADWTSDNESVGTVNNQGLFTALSEGSTTIRASVDGISAMITVTVRPPRLESLAVSPISAILNIGQRQNFTARGTFSDGLSRDVTNEVNWTSDNTQVGTIDRQGQFMALRRGSIRIHASLDGRSASASVTVRP